MINFNTMPQTITAALGAIVLSATFLVGFGRPGPCRPAPPAPDFGSGPGLNRGGRPGQQPSPWLASRPPPTPMSLGASSEMSIFSRTRDIIAANVIDLVNRSDDPAKTIRVIIMEMEETLVEVRAVGGAADRGPEGEEPPGRAARRPAGQLDRARRAGAEQGPRRPRPPRPGREGEADRPRRRAQRGDRRSSTRRCARSEGDIAKLQAKLREARVRQNAVATRFETAQNQVRLREMYAGAAHRGRLRQLRPARARGRPRRGPCRSADARRAAADARGRDCRIARRRARRRRARGDEAAEDRGMTISGQRPRHHGRSIQVVRIVGSIVSMLVVGLSSIWWLRPPRRVRDRREAIETDAADNRGIVADRRPDGSAARSARAGAGRPGRAAAGSADRDEDRIFAPAEDGRDSGRTE